MMEAKKSPDRSFASWRPREGISEAQSKSKAFRRRELGGATINLRSKI
jgi:hypothetical protein